MQNKIQEAYQLQGYLEKKSPAMFKGYQKRYFAVRDQGNLLLYYKKKPKSSESKPQSKSLYRLGILPICSIESIATVKGTTNEFIIVIPERQMQLKAENEEKRDFWIETLTFLKEYKEKQGNDEMKGSIVKKGNWSNLDKDTMTRIKLEDEKEHYMKMSGRMDTKNDEVMKCKGIYPYIQKFDARTQDQYILCGFLMKKGKLAKVTRAKTRWFILISSVALNGEPVDKAGPTQNDIPDTFKMNTIYYFAYDQRGDKSNFIDRIPVEEINEIQMMDIDKSEFLQVQKLPYGFTFTFKERTYNFFSEHLTEIDKWIKAINLVKAAPKINKQDQQKEVKEEIVYEGTLDKKHQNKLLTGPLSWKQVTATLKKNSLSWNGGDEQGNQYVLLIYIKEVIGKNKSFQVFTTDGEEYKFRADSAEDKDSWVKKIMTQVEQIKANMGNLEEILELPPEPEGNVEEEYVPKEEDLEDEETITAKFGKKMALNIEKQGGVSEEKVKKKGFFAKLFCCYGGGEDELEVEKDRGF